MAPDAPSVKPETTPQHTPGPWSMLPLAGGRGQFDVVADTVIRRTYLCRTTIGDASTANATLIIAAPDLLAALVAMVASYDGLRDVLTCPTVKAKLAAADAAIAKAKGRHA